MNNRVIVALLVVASIGILVVAAWAQSRTIPNEMFIQSGATKRINIPTVTADYQMTAYDRGVEVTTAGVVVTVPAYTDVTLGEVYTVVNNSIGDCSIATPGSDWFNLANGTTSNSLTIPSGASRSVLRRHSDGNWIVAGLGTVQMQTTFRIPQGTPTSDTPGTDGDLLMDGNYIYTFRSSTWSKSARTTLTP